MSASKLHADVAIVPSGDESLVAFMRRSPLFGLDSLTFERDPSLGRGDESIAGPLKPQIPNRHNQPSPP